MSEHFSQVGTKTLRDMNRDNARRNADSAARDELREGQNVRLAYRVPNSVGITTEDDLRVVRVEKLEGKSYVSSSGKAFGERSKKTTSYRYLVQNEKGSIWVDAEAING